MTQKNLRHNLESHFLVIQSSQNRVVNDWEPHGTTEGSALWMAITLILHHTITPRVVPQEENHPPNDLYSGSVNVKASNVCIPVLYIII